MNEFGRPTADDPATPEDEAAASELTQRDWLNTILDGLEPRRSSWNLGPLMWYSLRDSHAATASWHRQGLRRTTADDADGGAKPSWDAYADRSLRGWLSPFRSPLERHSRSPALPGARLSAAYAATPPIGEGAWSWFGDPRAVAHAGTTYVGWVDHEGDIKVSSYGHATGQRVTALLAARLNRDDHANPSIHVRPDGRLVVYYSRHVGPAMHYRVSSEPGDVRAWEAPQTLPVNVPGNRGYTYPNPIRLAAEGQTYLFWRGGNYNPTFSTQADGSGTWSRAQPDRRARTSGPTRSTRRAAATRSTWPTRTPTRTRRRA